jgi:hypothetical protein
VEDDEFLLFGGEMGVRMDSGGGEGLERLAASREGRRLDFFGNSLLKYGMMDEWTAG